MVRKRDFNLKSYTSLHIWPEKYDNDRVPMRGVKSLVSRGWRHIPKYGCFCEHKVKLLFKGTSSLIPITRAVHKHKATHLHGGFACCSLQHVSDRLRKAMQQNRQLQGWHKGLAGVPLPTEHIFPLRPRAFRAFKWILEVTPRAYKELMAVKSNISFL